MSQQKLPRTSKALGPSRPERLSRSEQRLFEALANPLCAREVAELLRLHPLQVTPRRRRR